MGEKCTSVISATVEKEPNKMKGIDQHINEEEQGLEEEINEIQI